MPKLYEQVVHRCPECPNYLFNDGGDYPLGFNYQTKQTIWQTHQCWHHNFKNGRIIFTDIDEYEYEEAKKQYAEQMRLFEESQKTLFPETSEPKLDTQNPFEILPDWCPLPDCEANNESN